MTTRETDRCPRCGTPTHTRHLIDGTRVVLNAHPEPVSGPETMVLLPDGTVMVSTPGSTQGYAVHRCETGDER